MMKWQYAYALVLLDDGKQVVSAEGEAPDGVDEGGFDENDFDLNDVLVSQLLVRDVESGRVVTGPLEGHTSVVLTLNMFPDGEILASGSGDNKVILWDTSTWQSKGLSCVAHPYLASDFNCVPVKQCIVLSFDLLALITRVSYIVLRSSV
jgi:WD40 repeat protein